MARQALAAMGDGQLGLPTVIADERNGVSFTGPSPAALGGKGRRQARCQRVEAVADRPSRRYPSRGRPWRTLPAQLLELAVGADAGVTKAAERVIGSIISSGKRNPLKLLGQAEPTKVLMGWTAPAPGIGVP
jgi:hypothetical protein